MTENTTYNISSAVTLHPFLKFLEQNASFVQNSISFEEDCTTQELTSATNTHESKSEDTSFFQITRPSLEVEKNILGFIAHYSQEQKIRFEDRIKEEILSKLTYFSYDDESIEPVWAVCERILENTSLDVLGNALQKIYLSQNDFPNVLCGICKYLTTFDLDEVSPWGPLILIGLLNHKNETVKEYAVMLLDNWKDKSLIPVLRNLDCSAPWLKAYIADVLLSMEE